MYESEFLKGATVRPYGRAKFFRDCARFGFLNAKMHNLPLFYLFWVIFQKICLFLAYFVYAKLSDRNIGRAKKITFRKSGLMMATQGQGNKVTYKKTPLGSSDVVHIA